MTQKISWLEILRKFFLVDTVLIIVGTFALVMPGVSLAAIGISSNLNVDRLRQLNFNFTLAPDGRMIKSLSAAGNLALSKSNLKTGAAVGQQFFNDYGKYFGVKNFSKELSILRREPDDLGMTHFVYEQRLNNVPVYGGQIILHLTSDLKVKSANGKIVAGVSISTKQKLTTPMALTQAKKFAKEKFGLNKVEATAPKLYILNLNLFNPKFSNSNQLVYVTTVSDRAKGLVEILFIDAKTGKLVFALDDTETLNRRIYNCNNEAGVDCFLYGEDDPNRNGRYEGQANSGVDQADSLYDLVGSTHEFFSDNYSLNGANGGGGIGFGFGGESRTSTAGFVNFIYSARSSSTCPNSHWDGNRIVFCDGTVNAAIVGHEYAHAVVQFQGPTPKLAYLNESGAMNEALADIFGQAIENKVTGRRSWQIGPTGLVWRHLSDPEGENFPATHYSDNFYCGDDDHGGVHQNSAVLNHVAYLLASGGELNGCTIQKIEPGHTERVFYRAMDKYLTTHANYMDFYEAANQACNDLYRSYSSICVSIKTALQAAELDQPGKCSAVGKARASCLPPANTRIIKDNQNFVLPTIDNPLSPNINNQVNLTPTVPSSIIVPNSTADSVVLDRKPNFTFSVSRDGMVGTMTGHINYYGEAAGCTVPRSWEPFAIHWGDGVDDKPTIVGGNFSAKHTYSRTATEYRTSVTVINSCNSNTTNYESTPEAGTTSVVETEVKIPSFTINVIQSGNSATLTGKIDYYGKGTNCSGPRPYDPVIVRWGDASEQPKVTNGGFSAQHTYFIKNKTYNLSVSVYNSCYGLKTENKTMVFY